MVIASAMIYKFWLSQTGSAVAHMRALQHLNQYGSDAETNKFKEVLEAHQKSREVMPIGEEGLVIPSPKRKPEKS